LADAAHLRLTDSQRLDWLRLFRSENVGPRGIMAQAPQGVLRNFVALARHEGAGGLGRDSCESPG
jgi:hypothetical protein